MRKYLFIIILFIAIYFIKIAFRAEGIPSKILFILGIIGIAKALLLLKAKASEKIIDWLARQPLIVYRIIASLQIAVGIIILKIRT